MYQFLSMVGGTTLYSGGGVMGEHALCEAAYSARCFMRLVELGVPFPTNEYGEYAGYKTDHDPRTRATSCGPLTSKYMTEALEKSVVSKGIEIIDFQRVIKILTDDNSVTGVACCNTVTGEISVAAVHTTQTKIPPSAFIISQIPKNMTI